jgi:nucleoside 2-deoxyribosyltransferase
MAASNKKPRTVYLCGPIMDATAEESATWRERAKTLFSPRFTLLDPMRRNFKDREVDSANEIVGFDLQDITDCDIVLVNYCKPSIGTAMEVFHASYNLDKFVIAFSPFPFQECSPWMVRFCTKILKDLESAAGYIEEHF